MLTSASACSWILFAWLIASDRQLPWGSTTARSPKPKGDAPGPKDSAKTRGNKLGVYTRIAAYIALAGLFWSWPSTTATDQEPLHTPSTGAAVSIQAEQLSSEKDVGGTIHQTQNPISDENFEDAIHNETLGFQKIFVVNLPERTDKRDALSLVSKLTGIKLTFANAIRGTQVPDKALPLGIDRAGWRDGGIGSWRSQMNVIRSMVEENVASALILEDDADWDVRLKTQLGLIAAGTRILLDRAHSEDAFASKFTPKEQRLDDIHSPYGHGWDILWLGHCGETFPERIPGHHEIYDKSSTRYTYYAMQDDETLPETPEGVTESWIAGDLERHRGTRWVHFSGGPTCSQAYALSQSGARKVLLALSVGGTLIEQLDNAISHLCRDHTPWDYPDDVGGPPGYPGAKMRCLSVNPAVFSQHKPRGRKAAESDIETVEDGDEFREEGESPNLVWSARLNIQNLMTGAPMQEQKSIANQTQLDG